MLLNISNDLHLSSLRLTDIGAYVNHLNDGGEISARTPVIPYPYTEEAANWWIRHRMEFTELAGREISFAIRNAEGVLIGSVGADDFRIGESHRAEVGFWVAKAYRNRGIATTALRVFIRYAFEELNLSRLTAHTLVFNTASARVLEKNGFEVEGYLRKHTRINGNLFDTLACGLLKEDWSARRRSNGEGNAMAG
jgi:RimJ/RimL family protein N-acetyltransferase